MSEYVDYELNSGLPSVRLLWLLRNVCSNKNKIEEFWEIIRRFDLPRVFASDIFIIQIYLLFFAAETVALANFSKSKNSPGCLAQFTVSLGQNSKNVFIRDIAESILSRLRAETNGYSLEFVGGDNTDIPTKLRDCESSTRQKPYLVSTNNLLSCSLSRSLHVGSREKFCKGQADNLNRHISSNESVHSHISSNVQSRSFVKPSRVSLTDLDIFFDSQ